MQNLQGPRRLCGIPKCRFGAPGQLRGRLQQPLLTARGSSWGTWRHRADQKSSKTVSYDSTMFSCQVGSGSCPDRVHLRFRSYANLLLDILYIMINLVVFPLPRRARQAKSMAGPKPQKHRRQKTDEHRQAQAWKKRR